MTELAEFGHGGLAVRAASQMELETDGFVRPESPQDPVGGLGVSQVGVAVAAVQLPHRLFDIPVGNLGD